MRRPLVLACVLATTALLPASAAAQLPTPTSTAIVPGKTIGGVGPGMTVARALAIWGPGSACTPESRRDSCYWRGTDLEGMASFVVGADGKVVYVAISAGRRGDDLAYAGPLMRWRTSRKLRLGVTTGFVVRKYPKVKGAPSGLQLGSGVHATTLQTSSGRIYQIDIGPLD